MEVVPCEFEGHDLRKQISARQSAKDGSLQARTCSSIRKVLRGAAGCTATRQPVKKVQAKMSYVACPEDAVEPE